MHITDNVTSHRFWVAAPPNRKSLLVAALKSLPTRVTVADGYRRLQDALVGTGFALDGQTKAGQKAVLEARKAAGFHAKQTSSGWIWLRSKHDS